MTNSKDQPQPAILTLNTGVPTNCYTQAEVLDYLLEHGFKRPRATQAVFQRAGVAQRHMVIDRDFFLTERTTQSRNNTYMAEAIPLGERVICEGLARAEILPDAIDDFIVVSCTGFSIPGLDLHLAGRMGLRSDLRRTCILGMGCYGTFPALLRAYESARQGRLALILSLELCSLHMQVDETNESIVSAALFADGAGMALIGIPQNGHTHAANTPRILHSATHCDYTTLDQMSFQVTDHGFRMYLSSYVPDLLATQVGQFVDGILATHHLRREDVRFWGIHPGSSKIVEYIQAQLGLSDAQVAPSLQVLNDYGNMSSATILFVLDTIQQQDNPTSGDYGVLLAFGPGLTMEGVLVQW